MVDFFRSAIQLNDDISPPDTGPYDVLGQLTPGQIEDMRADEEARKRIAIPDIKRRRPSVLMPGDRVRVMLQRMAKAEWN